MPQALMNRAPRGADASWCAIIRRFGRESNLPPLNSGAWSMNARHKLNQANFKAALVGGLVVGWLF